MIALGIALAAFLLVATAGVVVAYVGDRMTGRDIADGDIFDAPTEGEES